MVEETLNSFLSSNLVWSGLIVGVDHIAYIYNKTVP
jgi:hypothetical protein